MKGESSHSERGKEIERGIEKERVLWTSKLCVKNTMLETVACWKFWVCILLAVVSVLSWNSLHLWWMIPFTMRTVNESSSWSEQINSYYGKIYSGWNKTNQHKPLGVTKENIATKVFIFIWCNKNHNIKYTKKQNSNTFSFNVCILLLIFFYCFCLFYDKCLSVWQWHT